MPHRLVLLLSSERSGSTLTRVILGAHSRIVAPAEMFLMRYPDFRTFREEKPVAMESLVELFRLVGRPREAAEIDAACAGLATVDVYRWLLGFLGPEQILLDKTPAYANDGATLRRSLPLEPVYVWLVRHPLAVIESHVRLKHREHHTASPRGRARWARDTAVETFARWARGLSPLARQREVKWVIQQTVIREFLAGVPAAQQCTIRFEDLVRDPEPQVRRLCDAIGITPEPAMLEACGARQAMNPHLGDPNFHTHDRIDRATADLWRASFSEDQLTLETRRLMDAIGVAR
jgi:LPS sulfotransferase NodH